MDGCTIWLLGYLYDHGPTFTGHVKEAAKELGYTRADLKKARKEAGVKTWHAYDDEGMIDVWYWHLPNQKVGNQQ